MSELTSTQRKHQRGLGHALKPVGQIGRAGLSESVLASIEEALESHELVKVRLAGDKEEKAAAGAAICERLGCAAVGTIGHVLIFYRPARQAERRAIHLPE